jgi:hypothetical protein
LRADEGRETEALNFKPITNLKEKSELSNYCKPAAFVLHAVMGWRFFCRHSLIALEMFVFVQILIAIASPITVCQIIKNVAGSPKNSISNILCPFMNIVSEGIARARSPVSNNPSLMLSICMKMLFMSNTISPEIKQII